jgi:nucleoid DNA-binding protein
VPVAGQVATQTLDASQREYRNRPFLTPAAPLSILRRMATQLKPTKDKFTKTQIQDQIAESTCITRKQVAAVLDCLGEVIEAHLTKNAVGEFVLPGLMKISTVRKPAIKAHKGINPFTKEEVLFKAKPASTAVKVRPLKGLKDMAG